LTLQVGNTPVVRPSLAIKHRKQLFIFWGEYNPFHGTDRLIFRASLFDRSNLGIGQFGIYSHT